MGVTAENVAKKWNVSRQEQDEFAAASQQKAEAAQKAGRFKDEKVPITISTRKGDVIFDTDEYARHGTTASSLTSLKPTFDNSATVTTGYEPGINDRAPASVKESASNPHEP